MAEVTELLAKAALGDKQAFNSAFASILQELRSVAKNRLRADSQATLSPTMLVNETWLKLSASELKMAGRAHFFRIAAQALRQIWIDHMRSRSAEIERMRLFVESGEDGTDSEAWSEKLDWERAMQALEKADPELAELTDLHIFAGLELKEIAQMKGVSERTLQRHWRSARAFLRACLASQTSQTGLPELARQRHD